MKPPVRDPLAYPLGPALDFLQQLWRMNHALEKLSGRMEKSIGITAQQRLMVRCIGKYPGISASHLATVLHLDRATVSITLKRLEKKGLVKRRPDPRDKRRAFLGLTVKGRALDRPTRGTVEGAVERLLADASPRDVKVVSRVIEDFTEKLGQELGGG